MGEGVRLADIVNKHGKYALVGSNSQGKTYSLREFYKKHKSTTIFIENESKADEAIKSSINTSPLVEWLERLLDLRKVQKVINKQIESIDVSEAFCGTNINIKFNNAVANYKGLISAEIKTLSNQWGIPGSGETFLGELLMVEQMISQGKRNPIKYLIIDEPETFLHRSLYLKVIAILKRLSNKMVVIISTHSPEFVKIYADDLSEIIIVRAGTLYPLKDDQKYIEETVALKVFDRSNSNMSKNTKKLLDNYTQYFGFFVKPIIIDCLFDQIVVIGEGAAENALFECMKLRFAEEQFSWCTTYYALTGKYLMPAYIHLLKSLGIKVVTLFDFDEKNEWNPWNKSLNDYLIHESDAFYYFTDEIEQYLELGKVDRNDKGVKVPLMIQTSFMANNEKLLELMDVLCEKIKNVHEGRKPSNSDL